TERRQRGNGQYIEDGVLKDAKGDPEFRRRIKEARLANGWSAAELGKKMNASGASISSWEAGRFIPPEEKREKLVKLLGLPASLGAAASKQMEATRSGKGKPRVKGDAEWQQTVRTARKAAGMSSTEVGKKLGVDSSTVRAWENGSSVP